MGPEDLSAFRVEAGDAVRMPYQELPVAGDVEDHGRRVTGFLRGERAPKFLASVFVQGDDGAIGSSDETDQSLTIEQWMRGPTPDGRFGVEIRDEADRPNELAGCSVEAAQIAHCSQGEHTSLGHDGRRARTGRIVNAIAAIVSVLPHLRARASVQAEHAFVPGDLRDDTLPALALGHFAGDAVEEKHATICDGRSAIAAVDRHAPKHFRSAFGKFLDDAGFPP